MAIGLLGCPAPTTGEPTVAEADGVPRVSDVPLRIVVIGKLTNPEVIERRWLATSEQPINLQSQSIEEFLAAEECKADVLMFPSHLLGELVQRDWILKLPTEPQAIDAEQGGGEEERNYSAAALAACQYGGVQYALPLGCSVPQWIASSSLAEQLQGSTDERDPQVEFQQLRAFLEGLSNNSSQALPLVDDATIDRMALVDRFLTLMLHLSDRDPRFGLLFDIETTQLRLTAPEATQAIEFMRLLARQPDGLLSVVGSHDQAWTWAANHDQPVVALASTTLLGPEALQLSSGQELQLDDAAAMNVGHGLIMGLSSSCRQTFHSQNFVRWLSQASTVQVLAPVLMGVDPVQPLSVDATAWRFRQNLAPSLANDSMPQEPRLPQAHTLRSILAEALVAAVVRSEDAQQVLQQAAQRWSEASRLGREQLEREYKKSLGLRGS